MINFKLLEKLCSRFSKKEMPFLTAMTERFKSEKSYTGLKILHNVHLTMSTIWKLIPLLYSGAELTVTVTKNLKSNSEIADILKQAGVNYVEPEDLKNDFDIILDCCASVIDFIEPRLGMIELTQTGSVKCRESKLNYPVISIDESAVKKLETFYGTGDGFLRAFLGLTEENILNKKFVVFGYGKVGQGVVRSLTEFSDNIVVVEKNKGKVDLARSHKKIAYTIFEKAEIKAALHDAFCVITATGEEALMSHWFDKEYFSSCKYLANIGSEDEFGPKFSTEEVLYNKRPINFSLEEPTRMQFLDPIFYAHNVAIDLILSGTVKKGFNLLPEDIDLDILNRWSKYYNRDISEILSPKKTDNKFFYILNSFANPESYSDQIFSNLANYTS